MVVEIICEWLKKKNLFAVEWICQNVVQSYRVDSGWCAGNGVFFKKHVIINSSINKRSIRIVRPAVDSHTTVIIHATSEEILIASSHLRGDRRTRNFFLFSNRCVGKSFPWSLFSDVLCFIILSPYAGVELLVPFWLLLFLGCFPFNPKTTVALNLSRELRKTDTGRPARC